MRARIIGAVCGALVGAGLFTAMYFNVAYIVMAFFALIGIGACAVAGFFGVASIQKAREFRQKYGHSLWDSLR